MALLDLQAMDTPPVEMEGHGHGHGRPGSELSVTICERGSHLSVLICD